MRHTKHRHSLGVKKEHRAAMIGHLATALLLHGRIKTTLAKAKALRPFVEKIITLAKRAKAAPGPRAVYLRRLAIARVRDKAAIKMLFNERVDEFMDRDGGYTRIYKLADRRRGDAAEMALIELIDGSDEGYPKRKKRSAKAKSEAPAPAAAEESAAAATEEATTEEPAEEGAAEESAEKPAAEASEPEATPSEETEAEEEKKD